MAGEYGSLVVGVVANTRAMTQQIASSATAAGNAAGRVIGDGLRRGATSGAQSAGQRVAAIFGGGRIASALGGLTTGVGKVLSGIGSAAASAAKAVGNSLATGFTVATGAAAVFGAAVIKSGISYNTLMQTSNAAFKTILGSGEAATKMMDELTAFAQTSPFPRQAFIAATQQMLSFGIESKKIIPYLGAIQDSVAATGGSAQTLSEITLVMSQISAAGKITGTDLMQLAQRGINAADLIGSQMGKTGPEIKDAITAGTIPAGKALDALTAGMEAKFGGAAANVKKTWTGAMDRVKGAMRDMGSAIVEPFISKKGGGLALDWANSLADNMRRLIPPITDLVNNIAKRLGPTLAKIAPFLDKMTSGIITFIRQKGGVNGLLDSLSGLAPAIAPLAALLAGKGLGNIAGMLGPLGPLVEGLLGPLGGVGAALAAVVATSPDARAAFMDLAKGVMDAVGPIIKTLMPVLGTLGASVGKALGTVFSALTPVIATLAPLLGKVVTLIAAQLGPVLESLTPILASVIELIGPLLVAALELLMPSLSLLLPLLATVIKFLAGILANKAVTTVILGIAAAFGVLVLACYAMAFPMAAIVIGIAAVVAALIFMWTKVDWFRNGITAAWNFIWNILKTVFNWIKTNWPLLLAIITGPIGIATLLVIRNFTKIKTFVTTIINAVKSFLAAAWSFITGVFARGAAAITGFVGRLFGSVRTLFNSIKSAMVSAISNAVGAVLSFFGALPGRIVGALSGLPGKLGSAGYSAIHGLYEGITGAWHLISDFFSGLGSRIVGLVGDAASWLTGVGRDLVNGIISGIGSMAGSIVSALTDLIPGPLKKFASHLGLGSPSKLFRDKIGVWIPLGVAAGIDKAAPAVDAAIMNMMGGLPTEATPFGIGIAEARGLDARMANGRMGNTINVYPRQEQSEVQIAAAVDRRIAWVDASTGSAT